MKLSKVMLIAAIILVASSCSTTKVCTKTTIQVGSGDYRNHSMVRIDKYGCSNR